MADVITLRLTVPRWRRAVVALWIRARVLQEMVFPGSLDLDRETERMARFLCRVEVDD